MLWCCGVEMVMGWWGCGDGGGVWCCDVEMVMGLLYFFFVSSPLFVTVSWNPALCPYIFSLPKSIA